MGAKYTKTHFLKVLLLVVFILFSKTLFSQCPGVIITSNDTDICAPSAIEFEATGSKKSYKHEWVFNNDTVVGNPAFFTIKNQGVYDIKLNIYNSGTLICSDTKKEFIKAGKTPDDVKIDISKTVLCEGKGSVTFVGKNTGNLSWDWVVDGTIYNNASNIITHYFSSPGYKNVGVKIWNQTGCYRIKKFDSAILVVSPPDLDFIADKQVGYKVLNVNLFSDIKSKGQDINTYQWTLNGGSPAYSDDKDPSNVSFGTEGVYDIKLKVRIEDSCTYEVEKPEFIKVADSVYLNLKVNKSKICKGETAEIFNLSNGSSYGNFTWDFPGGNVISDPDNDTQRVIYDVPGSYDISLHYNIFGLEQEKTIKNAISVRSINANFYASDTCFCSVPAVIDFNNFSSGPPEGGSSVYQWNVLSGNGKTVIFSSYQKNASFTFTNFGTYDIQLKMFHSSGCVDSRYKNDYVNIQPFTDSNEFEDIKSCVDANTTLYYNKALFCSGDSLLFNWKVYNKDEKTVLFTSTRGRPVFKFPDSGSYRFEVDIATKNGCISKGNYGYVRVVIPTLDFTGDTLACTNENIEIVPLTIPDDLEYKHSWEIINNSDPSKKYTSQGNPLKIKIPEPGIYDVLYNISYNGGCRDTLKVKKYLKVGGIDADFVFDSNSTCLPFHGVLKSKILSNVDYGSKPSVKYNWVVKPFSGISPNSSTDKNPNLLITKASCYDVTLEVTNSQNCQEKITKNSYICVGTEADFQLPDVVCLGNSYQVKDKSKVSVTGYKWSTNDSSIVFSSKIDAEPKVTFRKPGSYKITLEVYNDDGCRDTLTKDITVQKVTADFFSSDTFNICAPTLVRFDALSLNADTFMWDFGEEPGIDVITGKNSTGYIYEKNSGYDTSGYDVTLIAKSRYGCYDTVKKKKYITIVGPKLDFNVSPNEGCSPLLINFSNKSLNVANFFFEYGDGSPTDTNEVYPHYYALPDSSVTKFEFSPIVYAIDQAGCKTFYEPDSPIVVYRTPEAGFFIDTSFGCEPLKVSFTDTSLYETSVKWDLDGDGNFDSSTQHPLFKYDHGKYNITQVVFAGNVCADTLVKDSLIDVFDKPKADFYATPRRLCPFDSVHFINGVSAIISVNKYHWDFGDSTLLGDTSLMADPSKYVYSKPGSYNVSLSVSNEKGCADTIVKNSFITVVDTLQKASGIAYVTFENNQSVKVVWLKNQFERFRNYDLTVSPDKGQHQVLTSIQNASDTSFIHDFHHQVQEEELSFYQLNTSDSCDVTLSSNFHKPPFLEVKTSGYYALQLNWSKYEGWPTVRSYKVFRSEGDSNFIELKTVAASDTSLLDENICKQYYCYYIEAIHPNGEYHAKSNMVCDSPISRKFVAGPVVNLTTVLDDSVTLTTWQPKTLTPFKKYAIDKYTTEKGWKNNFRFTKETSFVDTAVDVHANFYRYRVHLQDFCGNLSYPGDIGTSLLLQAKIIDERTFLYWNKYEKFPDGVKEYVINLKRGAHGFTKIKTLNPDDTSFIDENIYSHIQGEYCYQVVGVSMNEEDSSYSNIQCAVVPSNVFIPNAFTPDGDGLNDVFKVTANSILNELGGKIQNFELVVYNLWGEKIFETNDYLKGWDGTHHDVDVPEGIYIFYVKALGLDDKIFFKRGSVTLLRHGKQ